MTDDMFAEPVGVDDFALPDDADRIALKNAKAGVAVADEPAAVEAPPVEEEEAAPVEDRPRNPDGTFAAKDPDPDVEETPAEKLYAGKYKSADELERAYQELQSLAGRQGSEISDLRTAFEERLTQIDERLATPVAPPVQITSDLIETNPAYAAQLAYEQDNGTAFQIAFEAWKETDPFTASTWASAKQTDMQIAEMRKEHQQQLAAVQAQIAPVAQTAQAAQLTTLIAQKPGLAEFVASDQVAVIAQEFPEVAAAIVSGTPEQRVRSLETLHQISRGRTSDTLKVTQEQVGRETAEAAQQAREEAFVASATTTSSGVKPSRSDEIAAEWDAMDAPFNDGWHV